MTFHFWKDLSTDVDCIFHLISQTEILTVELIDGQQMKLEGDMWGLWEDDEEHHRLPVLSMCSQSD
jgi:hypothetical protein